MKKTSKILSVFLSLIMVISIIPMSGISVSATTYSGACGENLTWMFDDSTGVLMISGAGAMENYESYHDVPWNDFRLQIEKVVINNGVTTIGDYAFNSCYNLNRATIPDSVTVIGHFAFFECRGLSILVIPEGVITFGIYAFAECRNLKVIAIPDSVTSISRSAFEWSTSLMDVYYSGTEEKWSNITIDSENDSLLNATIHYEGYIDGLISGVCGENLTWIFDEETGTLTVSGTGEMYSYYDMENGTLIDCPWGGFVGNIETIVIEDGVTTIGDAAFALCTLTNVTIPDSVTTIGNLAFALCTLTSVSIPNSVTKIGYSAFAECESLADVYYSGTEAQWNEISIDLYNEYLTNATVHYNYRTSDNEGVVIVPENEEGLPEGTELNVTIVETTEDSIIFDITLENNGAEIQPNGNVTVKIPVPTDMDTNGLSVYRAEEDGTYTDMNAVYEDGYMVFTTDHFSIYVMTVEELTAPSEPECSHADNGGDGYCDDCNELLDPSVECECNCHKTGISKFFFNLILFFQKLFGSNKTCECGVAHY